MELEDFFRDTKINMYLGWLLTLSIAAVLVESIIDFDTLWILFSTVMISVIVLPSLTHRNLRVMLPWEVILMGAIPVIVRTLEISLLSNQVTTYLSMGALALIIAVELHIYTKIKFNHAFAVGFTVIATLALAGIWAVIRYNMDIYLGTSYLTTNEDLMKEFINATLAGIFSGAIFDTYFKRRDRKFRKMMKKVIRE